MLPERGTLYSLCPRGTDRKRAVWNPRKSRGEKEITLEMLLPWQAGSKGGQVDDEYLVCLVKASVGRVPANGMARLVTLIRPLFSCQDRV